MSVAFRRESDEEHKEPRFELPIPPGPNWVTPRGRALIAARVDALEAEIAGAPNDAAREVLRRDLRYWHTRRATAEDAPAPDAGEVGIGSRVHIRQGARTRTIEIVGHDEAEPGADRLSFAAPLARALMGAMAGETVAFNGQPIRVDSVETSA